MRAAGYALDARIFVAALKACSELAAKEEGNQVGGKLVKMGSLDKGMAIHSQAAKSACESDLFVASTLVDVYAKCGSMVDARWVFDRMLRHDVVSWNALLLGYAENEEGEVALRLFARMLPEGCAPDARTVVAALKACTGLAAKEECVQVDGKLVKLGSLEKAMGIHSQPAKSGCDFGLFERMQKEQVQVNGITYLSLLSACSHAGLVDKGKEYFQVMCSKYGISPAIEHYHCMVDILGRANQLDDAVAMVKTMPFKPNSVTWLTVRMWQWEGLPFPSLWKWVDRQGISNGMEPKAIGATLHL